MLKFDGEKWVLYEKKISYSRPNIIFVDEVNIDPSWTDVEVEDIELTLEQTKRFEQVKYFEDVDTDTLENYIINGTLPEEYPSFLARLAHQEKEDAKTQVIKDLVDFDNASIEELEALDFLHKKFEHGILIEKNDLVEYEGGLYISLSDHIADENFPPGETDYRYTVKRKGTHSDGEDPDPWVQPTGYQNAYSKGDRVLYLPDGLIYISQIDGNAEEPTKDEPHNRWWKLDVSENAPTEPIEQEE